MEWFETKNILPSDNKSVLIWYEYAPNLSMTVAVYQDGQFYITIDGFEESVGTPTHWCELPPPPNK